MRTVLFLGFCAVAAMFGCSGSDAPACNGGRACGGDLHGGWNVDAKESCIEGLSVAQHQELLSFCPDTFFDFSGVKLGGDVTFQKDGSFSQNLKFSGKVQLLIGSTCLVQQGTRLNCSELAGATPTMSGFVCKDASGACACSAAPGALAATGTFATKSGTLTQTPEAGTARKSDYCVEGDILYLSPRGESASDSGEIALRANLVLTRGK